MALFALTPATGDGATTHFVASALVPGGALYADRIRMLPGTDYTESVAGGVSVYDFVAAPVNGALLSLFGTSISGTATALTDFTADGLIARIKVRAALPKTLNLTDQKILDAINEELCSEMVPMLLAAKSALFDASVDLPLVSGQQNYLIPQRAALSKVHLLTYVDAAGTESKPLKKVERADIHDYAPSGVPTAFYFSQAEVMLLPPPSGSVGYLRIRYPRRPSELVLAADVGVVAAVTSDTRLTVGAVPSSIAVGKRFDIGQAVSPFKPLADDLLVTAATGTTIDVSGGLNKLGIAVGDYVTPQRTAYVPQLPQEWHTVLMLRTVARLHNDAKDIRARDATLQLAVDKQKALGAAQDARADENPKRMNAWRGHRRRWGWR